MAFLNILRRCDNGLYYVNGIYLSKEFGEDSYMKDNYMLSDRFYDGNERTGIPFLSIWESFEFKDLTRPKYLAQLHGNEKNFIVFLNYVDVIEYINSLIPIITFMSKRKP